MNITLRQLEIFKACAELEHFSQAAKALFMTPPAITKQIQALEEQVGEKLFVSVGKRVQLSHHGKLFYKQCLKVLNAYTSLQEWVKYDLQQQTRPIRLSMSPGINNVFFNIIHNYKMQQPDLVFNLSSHMDYETPLKALLAHTVDGFVGTDLIQNQQIQSFKIMCLEFYQVSKIGADLSAADRLIVPYADKNRLEMTVKQACYVDSYGDVKDAVLAELGMGLLPLNLIDSKTMVCEPAEPILKKDIYINVRAQDSFDGLDNFIHYCQHHIGA